MKTIMLVASAVQIRLIRVRTCFVRYSSEELVQTTLARKQAYTFFEPHGGFICQSALFCVLMHRLDAYDLTVLEALFGNPYKIRLRRITGSCILQASRFKSMRSSADQFPQIPYL